MVTTGIVLLEMSVVFLSGVFSYVLAGEGLTRHLPHLGAWLWLTLIVAALFPLLSLALRSVDCRGLASGSLRLAQLASAWAITILGVYGAFAAFEFPQSVPPHSLRAWAFFGGLALVAVRLVSWRVLAGWHRHGRLKKSVVVLGGGEHGRRFIRSAAQRGAEVNLKGFFDDRASRVPEAIAGIAYMGNSAALLDYVRDHHVDEIVIALPWSAENRILLLLQKLRHLPVVVRLAPEILPDRLVGGTGGSCELPLLNIFDRPLSEWSQLIKDVEDRALALFLLCFLAPLMLMIALLIKLDSPGPVFFRQQRLGFGNKPFRVFKFRTLRHSPTPDGGLRQVTATDSRVTRIGRILRKTSLDEIPQLLNIVTGDMSLVGPRPHPMWKRAGDLWRAAGDAPLEAVVAEYAARHRVKPGITGWAQVCGFRGETETIEKMQRRVECDLYYIDNWSLWFDMKILALTLVAVARPTNAY